MMNINSSSRIFFAFQQFSVHIYLVCRNTSTKDVSITMADPTTLNIFLLILVMVK